MARIFFMAFDAAGQGPLQKKLRAAGHKLVITEPRYPEFYTLLKQQDPPPELFLADCSKLPSHARESCNYLQGLAAFRSVPILLYNVKREDEAKTHERVPRATLVFDDRVEGALAALLAPSK